MNIEAEVVANIRRALADLELPQKVLARILGVTEASVSRRLKAKTFTVTDLQIISEGLGVTYESLAIPSRKETHTESVVLPRFEVPA